MKAFVKVDASPGSPCAKTALRNDQLLDILGERFNDIVLDRIEAILDLGEKELLELTRRERMDLNLMDPVRVFVKNEPHKISKIKEGRVRLIMSVSLVDKMIEMLISRHLCKLEIQNWRDIPSKPGIGFSEQDNRSVYEDVTFSPFEMMYADVSGWDMSVKDWMIRDEADVIVKLCDNPSPVWEHLLRMKAILESESIFQFSDGELVVTNFKGIVNSGKQRTSRGNSFIRVRLADLVGSRKTLAAGDDTVESKAEDAYNKYASFGITLKEYEPVTDSFEFCSHKYTPTGAYALNAEKMVMNLLHQNPTTPMEMRLSLIGFRDELSSRPDFASIVEDVESVGYFEVEGPHYDTSKYIDL